MHVVVAAVDPELKGRGQASFIVPPKTKGLSQGQKYLKHGIRASDTAEVVLEDVRVPGRCLLGGIEKLDAKLARYREGTSSGKQLAIAFKLANMITEIDAAPRFTRFLKARAKFSNLLLRAQSLACGSNKNYLVGLFCARPRSLVLAKSVP